MADTKINRALLSVTDKTGLAEFAKFLHDNRVELIRQVCRRLLSPHRQHAHRDGSAAPPLRVQRVRAGEAGAHVASNSRVRNCRDGSK